MYKKTITYKGFDDIERTEDFFFHISKAELVKMENSVQGGLVEKLQKMLNSKDGPAISESFDWLIEKSYGVKHEDGRQFVKNKEVYDAFVQTEAYSIFYMELISDDTVASEFINGIIPADLADEVKKMTPEQLGIQK